MRACAASARLDGSTHPVRERGAPIRPHALASRAGSSAGRSRSVSDDPRAPHLRERRSADPLEPIEAAGSRKRGPPACPRPAHPAAAVAAVPGVDCLLTSRRPRARWTPAQRGATELSQDETRLLLKVSRWVEGSIVVSIAWNVFLAGSRSGDTASRWSGLWGLGSLLVALGFILGSPDALPVLLRQGTRRIYTVFVPMRLFILE
jgi:hypothetical protein